MAGRPATWSFSSSGLELEVTTAYDTKTFREFFAEYDKVFVLPAEKEEASGFAACLALNRGPGHARLAAEYGDFLELCLVARDAGVLIGGANLIALRFPGPNGDPTVTSNLNYIFTTGAARGKGYFRRLLAAIRPLVVSIFPGPEPLIFVEQNDPFRMTDEAYAEDTARAGIDQFDRLLAWAKVGARVLDFPYVQPGLSADQPADDTLVYALLDPPADRLPASVLREHLRRFFAISVAKGEPLTAPLPELPETVRILDPRPLLDAVTGSADRFGHWARRPVSLQTAILG